MLAWPERVAAGGKFDKLPPIRSLYYITHVDNLPSMFRHGILAHAEVERRGLPFTPIYDEAIVSNRKAKTTPDGRSLWEFANLYFNARNPMLYRVGCEKPIEKVAVLGVNPQVLYACAYLTDGNAANGPTEFYEPGPEATKVLAKNWSTVTSDWWNSADGSKRKIMAECLVPTSVPAEMISTVYVVSHEVAESVSAAHVVPEPNMFFRPTARDRLTSTLSLADGDMFFSRLQTLTISVNVVGIMGKGLASRAKYQFPDVYVRYQDLCRRKALKMGKPALYKREASLDDELADEPSTLKMSNASKWFLLFPTKRHWREDSDLAGIEAGLVWLVENYEKLGMESLAIPALGCGLGNLDWRDVGPIMCRHLAKMTIPCCIYLPREHPIPPEYRSPDYLLAKR